MTDPDPTLIAKMEEAHLTAKIITNSDGSPSLRIRSNGDAAEIAARIAQDALDTQAAKYAELASEAVRVADLLSNVGGVEWDATLATLIEALTALGETR